MHTIDARYIAIDNVCAWPVLLKNPNSDEMYVIIHNSPSHGWREGSLDCYISQDSGHSWQFQGTPAPHKTSQNRIHIAAGWDHSGNMMVLSNGFKPDLKNKNRGNVTGIWTSISSDKGKSWDIFYETTGAVPSEHQIPFGRIHPISNDKLIAGFYRPYTQDDSQTWSGTSSDQGKTWRDDQAKVNLNDGNECSILPINDHGELIAATRTHIDHHLDISRSQDFGKTWNRENAVTLAMQHPGDLTLLNNGNVLLTYAIRNSGMQSIAYRISEDQGKTWKAPKSLVQLKDAKDFGYPSSIQLSDSSIVTAYYLSNGESHSRYHMGTVIWNINDDE